MIPHPTDSSLDDIATFFYFFARFERVGFSKLDSSEDLLALRFLPFEGLHDGQYHSPSGTAVKGGDKHDMWNSLLQTSQSRISSG
jgi:hypothetical protein